MGIYHIRCHVEGKNFDSQALSRRPPFVVRRKTLVAAGHVTIQNLDGKKICWARAVAKYFDCCCGNLCAFQNLEQSLKTTRSIGLRSRIWRWRMFTILQSSLQRTAPVLNSHGGFLNSRFKPLRRDSWTRARFFLIYWSTANSTGIFVECFISKGYVTNMWYIQTGYCK